MVGITTVAGIIIARTLGSEGRGYYAAIMAWFALAQVLGELGQSGAVTYWVSKDREQGRRYVGSSRMLMLIVGGIVSVLGILFSDMLSGGKADVTIAYQIAFAGCLLNSLCASSIYAVQAISISRWNAVRLVQPIAYFVLVSMLALLGELTVVSLSIALVGSIGIQFAVVLFESSKLGLAGGKADRASMGRLAKFGLAHTGSAIPATLSTQYDRLVLSRLAPSAQLGEYAVAGSVAGLAFPFSTAVASVVFPRSASGSTDEVTRRRLEARAVWVSVAVGLAISVGIGLFAAPLIPWVFGPSFGPAVQLVWWLLPAVFFRSISQVLNALLRGRQRPGLVTYGQLAGLAVGAGLILPLVGVLGIRGAALSSSIGELIVLLVALWLLRVVRKGRVVDGGGGTQPRFGSDFEKPDALDGDSGR